MLRKIITSPWTALITLALVVGLRVADPTFVESIRLRYFDTLVTSKAPEVIGVHVVNIDEKALEKYGQFPFSRDTYANIIRDLYRRNAGLVVFNILTPDRDRSGRDGDYVQALRQYPTILPNLGAQQTRNQPKQPGSVVIGPYENQIVEYPGIIANVPQVEQAAAGVGIVNTFPEIDGVVRRAPLLIASGGKLYPSLAMETLRVAGADTTFQVKLNENGIEKMRIPAFGPITTDSLSRIWIDWSMVPEVHSLTELPKDFDGEIVIVGVSAAGLANPVATSKGEMLPQELQAAILGTVIANKDRPVITRPDWADGAEVIAIVVLGLVLLFLTRWTYVGIISGVIIVGAIIPLCGIAYSSHSWLVDASLPIAGLVLVLLHAYSVKFISEFLQKQQIKKQFGSYVNPTIVERLQQHPELIRLGGEKKELSIVMTDMRNFTALGESYGEAGVEDFTKVMNSYMTALSVPILKNDGTLIKFIGDASLHIHGAPIDDANHAKRAVQTALDMIEAVKGFNLSLAELGKPPVGMGAGVNTGETVVGNIGAKTKFGYDVLGDSVSIAARLEGQTKGYGVLCIIGPSTYEQVKDEYLCLELDNIAVKGKSVGLQIYTPLGLRSELNVSKGDEQMHAAMIELYRQQKFDQAIKFCGDLAGRFNGAMDHYYEIWVDRCVDMKNADLPKDWDGIYRATSK
jgi:adenylate cyclase